LGVGDIALCCACGKDMAISEGGDFHHPRRRIDAENQTLIHHPPRWICGALNRQFAKPVLADALLRFTTNNSTTICLDVLFYICHTICIKDKS